MLTNDDSRDPGWIAMRCVNHPTLRWTRKDPEAMRGAISRNIQLMFDGDMANPERKAHPFDTSGASMGPELKAKFEADGYVFECACSYNDLEFVEARGTEAEDNAPKTKAEFDAVINRIRHEQQDALGIPRD